MCADWEEVKPFHVVEIIEVVEGEIYCEQLMQGEAIALRVRGTKV